jgi:hypothetical protein
MERARSRSSLGGLPACGDSLPPPVLRFDPPPSPPSLTLHAHAFLSRSRSLAPPPEPQLAAVFEGKDLRQTTSIELDNLKLTGLAQQDLLELAALQLCPRAPDLTLPRAWEISARDGA